MEVREGLDAKERLRREVLRGDDGVGVRLPTGDELVVRPKRLAGVGRVDGDVDQIGHGAALVPGCSVVVHAVVTTSTDAVVVSCEHVWTRTSNVALGRRRKNSP